MARIEARAPADRSAPALRPDTLAAIDLGTNNCRLLIACAAGRTFQVLETYSRIVRLGEGLSRTGTLGEEPMGRALQALEVCAARIRRRGAGRVAAVATQACRIASNGLEFVREAARRTGLELRIISARQEAELAVAGCLDLIDPAARAALVLDVGGGSTELSWLDLSAPFFVEKDRLRRRRPPLHAWLSVPIGVVTLAEQFPETRAADAAWFRSMVERVKTYIAPFARADRLRPHFFAGNAHLVGASGAITSLAGLHLDLPRYVRQRVDGLWMTREQCRTAATRLAQLSRAERARQPCIGPDRADLVLAGAAILQAVQEVWPCERVRVADRGLREGLILGLLAKAQIRSGPRDCGDRRR